MRKALTIAKVISFIIIVLQLLFVGTFSVLYFNDFFEIKSYVTSFEIAVVAAGIVFVDTVYLWAITIFVSSLKQKSDLKAAEIIGNDVQEAYNFAMLGLAITDENNVVFWTNDLFQNRHLDIIDTDILAWQPELEKLRDATSQVDSVKIDINTRIYEVKLIPDAGLWIFKDISDYESVVAYSKEQAPVIGVLTLDNFDDVVGNDDAFSDLVASVKNIIFAYAKEYGILLRRIKEDTYSLLCNYDSFCKLKDDNFSIIDKVRDASSDEDIPLTISMGIAYDFPDVIKLNELANAALDIAMSRGGDQVVISEYGQEMQFIGGKSNAQEKRNRVKIRVLADSLIQLIKNASNVIVMGHTNMDMDAFGACLGIKAICNRLKVPALVVVDFKATELKTRSALMSSFSKEELDKLVVSSRDANDKLNGDTLLVVCDVHTPNMVMAPKLLDVASKIVIIDHHRRAEDYIDSPVFNHIDPSASSTCELITEFIRFSSINPKIEVPSTYATIMLSGIFLDSSYFKSKSTGIRTFEAATILKEFGADNALADDFLKDDFEEYRLINDMISHLDHPFNGVAVATANPTDLFDNATIAKAANTCLTFKGIHASFVIGKVGQNEVKISCRSDGAINVSLLAEKLGGGGHYTAAAVSFQNQDVGTVKNMLFKVLERSLAEATNAERNSEED